MCLLSCFLIHFRRWKTFLPWIGRLEKLGATMDTAQGKVSGSDATRSNWMIFISLIFIIFHIYIYSSTYLLHLYHIIQYFQTFFMQRFFFGRLSRTKNVKAISGQSCQVYAQCAMTLSEPVPEAGGSLCVLAMTIYIYTLYTVYIYILYICIIYIYHYISYIIIYI